MDKEEIVAFDENYWAIRAWRSSISLSVEMEKVFINLTQHHLFDDMLKTGLEISSQIAIAFEERKHQKSIGFLVKAKHACTRLRTRLYLAKEMLILNQNMAVKLIEKTREVATMLSKALETIHQSNNQEI